MKLKKFNKSNKYINKIFQIKLIKNQIYNKNYTSIKTNIKIIYSLMTKNKKILLIGNLNKINFFYKFITSNNNLMYIPKNMLLNGFFSNIYVFKHFCLRKKKDIFKFLFNFKLFNFDLIVVFENNSHSNEILKLNKIPVIFLYNSTPALLNHYHLNFVPLVEKENDIFYFMIYSVFNRYRKTT